MQQRRSTRDISRLRGVYRVPKAKEGFLESLESDSENPRIDSASEEVQQGEKEEAGKRGTGQEEGQEKGEGGGSKRGSDRGEVNGGYAESGSSFEGSEIKGDKDKGKDLEEQRERAKKGKRRGKEKKGKKRGKKHKKKLEEYEDSDSPVSHHGGSDTEKSARDKGKDGRLPSRVGKTAETKSTGDSEEESGTENARDATGRAEQRHYEYCGSWACGREAAPVLLAEHSRRRREAEAAGSKGMTKDLEEWTAEEKEARDKNLRAWIGCETCVSAHHFKSLSASLQQKLKARLDAEYARSSTTQREKAEGVDKVLTTRKRVQ
ncbi:hypothetical protein JCM16303_002063 [Sporobolomyces ruberrimus]